MATKGTKPSVTQRAFAARAGTSTGTISRLVKEGILPKRVDGSIPLDEGLMAWGQYQAAHAGDGRSSPRAEVAPALDVRAAKLRAELREREAKAEARETENAARRGELVPRVDVVADALAVGELVRQHLTTLAPRIAPQVDAIDPGPRRVALIEALIADEVQRALGELQRSAYHPETAA